MMDLIKLDAMKLNNTNNFSYYLLFKSLLLSNGFQLVLLYRLSSFFRRRKIKVLSVILDKIQFFIFNCEIRSSAKIGGGLVIRHPIGVVIGGKVEIGDNFSIGQNTTIGGNNGKLREGSISQPIIGNDVTIGANSMVIGPIILEDKSFVGAMSLVNKSIGYNEVWVGIPARKIK